MATNISIGEIKGSGTPLTETNLSAFYSALKLGTGYVISGYALTDPTGLFVDITSGDSFVTGFLINQTTAQNGQALAANETNSIWLNPDGALEIETTGVPTDSDALLLGTAVTDGASITALSHRHDIANGANVCIFKDADQTDSAGDSELRFTMNAREIWDVQLIYIVTQSDAGSDFIVKFSSPSGHIMIMAMGPTSAGGVSTTFSGGTREATGDHTSTLITQQIIIEHIITTGTVVYVRVIVYVGKTGGTAIAQWAQGAPPDVTVNAGSVLIARRVLG